MIIIQIDKNNNIEKALKTLKSKVIKTKQNKILFDKKEYTKPSVEKRLAKQKAIYTQKKMNS